MRIVEIWSLFVCRSLRIWPPLYGHQPRGPLRVRAYIPMGSDVWNTSLPLVAALSPSHSLPSVIVEFPVSDGAFSFPPDAIASFWAVVADLQPASSLLPGVGRPDTPIAKLSGLALADVEWRLRSMAPIHSALGHLRGYSERTHPNALVGTSTVWRFLVNGFSRIHQIHPTGRRAVA